MLQQRHCFLYNNLVIQDFVFKYRYQLFLAIILVIGLWLRLYRLPDQVWSQLTSDESRDMLVADHIYRYGESVDRGPLAAGGLSYLMNSPVYFYLVTILWMIAQNPTSFMYLWTTILAGQVLLAYLVGKELGDKTTGIIASIVFALHNQLILQSRQLSQPHLLPIFSLLFLWVLLKNQKKSKITYILLMIFLLLFPLHLHYGIFIILPAGAWWVFYFWGKILEDKPTVKNILLPILTTIGLIFSWLATTYKVMMFDQLFFFEKLFKNSGNLSFDNLDQLSLQLKDNLLTSFSLPWTILFVLFFTSLSFFWLKKKNHQVGIINWAIISSLAFSALLGGLFPGYIFNTYLLSTLPFFLILLSIGMRQLISLNRFIGLIITSLVLYFIYIPTQYLLFFQTPLKSFEKQNYELAEVIYQDYLRFSSSKDQLANFGIATLITGNHLPFDGWGTSGVWFHLEKIASQQMIELTNYGVSHYPLRTNIDYLYFICDHRTQPERINESCLNRFVENRNYLAGYPKIIYKSKNYTIWKTKINSEKYSGYYYKVYE
jgi:4-amino-4-deoxy-L-arabinose transferase-like glycosyltransferase